MCQSRFVLVCLILFLAGPASAKTAKKPALDLAPSCGIPGKGGPECTPGTDESRLMKDATAKKPPYEPPTANRENGAGGGGSCKLTTDCPRGTFCTPSGHCAGPGSPEQAPGQGLSPFTTTK